MTIRNDFPDFGTQASFVTFNPDTYTVLSIFNEVVAYDISNYQYGVVYLSKDSVAVDSDLAFQWMGTVGAESSVITESRFTILPDGTVTIPFQALSPTLRISDVDSSSYPYDLTVALTLFTNPPYQHGHPGGVFAINDARTIVMGDTQTFIPTACGPGFHNLAVATTSTDWSATLRQWPRRNFPVSFQTNNSSSGDSFGGQYYLAATQWVYEITNDAADADFGVSVGRFPAQQ